MAIVGDIVHFNGERPTEWGEPDRVEPVKGQPWPAIVTHVWNDDEANLSIVTDATFRFPLGAIKIVRARRGNRPGMWMPRA